ncbi:MAG TPA: protein-glutamate O-methyltransferase [Gemmatimonadaceae bacterium]|nr:protein-glutamate O-methyltransferase [Gemmatimonadaceae bacterium]
MPAGPPALGAEVFRRIGEMVSPVCGIELPPGKEELVRSRLTGRLRALGLASFDAYLAYIARDATGRELAAMVDAITTNKTSFFRESLHFDYLRQHALPALRARGGPVRMWSAGCSSGEEPYSLAMLVRDTMPDGEWCDVRILATDISRRMLERARAAVYDEEAVRELPAEVVMRHFIVQSGEPRTYRVTDAVRALVRIAHLNLMSPWPMRGPFDVIFCRNVMIYFDRATQQRLIDRLWQLLAPGGELFVGHAESLTGLAHRFTYVRPAVYVKPFDTR